MQFGKLEVLDQRMLSANALWRKLPENLVLHAINAAIIPWSIISIELTLKWNHIREIYSIQSAGQLIPFLVGLAGFLRLLQMVSVKRSRVRMTDLVLVGPASFWTPQMCWLDSCILIVGQKSLGSFMIHVKAWLTVEHRSFSLIMAMRTMSPSHTIFTRIKISRLHLYMTVPKLSSETKAFWSQRGKALTWDFGKLPKLPTEMVTVSVLWSLGA